MKKPQPPVVFPHSQCGTFLKFVQSRPVNPLVALSDEVITEAADFTARLTNQYRSLAGLAGVEQGGNCLLLSAIGAWVLHAHLLSRCGWYFMPRVCAGSARFSVNTEHNGSQEIAYLWSPETPQSQASVASGGMPEFHSWVELDMVNAPGAAKHSEDDACLHFIFDPSLQEIHALSETCCGRPWEVGSLPNSLMHVYNCRYVAGSSSVIRGGGELPNVNPFDCSQGKRVLEFEYQPHPMAEALVSYHVRNLHRDERLRYLFNAVN